MTKLRHSKRYAALNSLTITAHSCKDAMEVISADRFGILSMGQAFITFSAFAKNSIFLFHSIVIRLVAFSLLT